MSHGALYDTSDVEAMEVLRGPQGLLFGRNVTGGAVVLRTRRPSHDFSFRAKASVTDDNDQVYSVSTTGSLIPDVLAGKLSVYGRDDAGYFEDVTADNDHFGEAETYIIRPAVTWTITEDLETTLIYERGEDRGGQAVPYNTIDPAGDFKVRTHTSPDEEVGKFNNARWMHIISETNYDIAFGNGTLTNITTYREVDEESDGDLDGTDTFGYEFHSGAKIEQNQFSNELRYAGSFLDDKLALTLGSYYFSQNISMAAYRSLDFRALVPTPAAFATFPLATQIAVVSGASGGATDNPLAYPTVYNGYDQDPFTYGGDQEHKTWGFFANGDYQLYDNLTMSLGLRYTFEEKGIKAAIAQLETAGDLPGLGVNLGGCTIEPSIKCGYDFIDDDDWSNWTPRVAFQYYYNDSSHIYFSYSKGFRSGGFNIRNSGKTQKPGPWDEESQNTWELGMKSEWDEGRVRFNLAMFLNQISDIIREEIFSDGTNIVQQIRNTADADITGIEIDLNWLASDNLLLYMNVGYVDGEYKEVKGDLNVDGVVDGKDKSLNLPRLAPWSGSIGGSYDIPVSAGLISTRLSYSHRSAAFISDSNVETLGSHDELAAGISFTTQDGKWKASLFGKNLLDQIQRNAKITLPGGLADFTPIKKGRVLGVELEYQY
jgi:iron complex outermembrane recepter protein